MQPEIEAKEQYLVTKHADHIRTGCAIGQLIGQEYRDRQ